MPRVVNEIQEGNLRPTARPQDVYYRPAVGPESRLEKIASSFVGISADLGRYFSNRRKKQEDLEIAQGVELYKKRLAEGEQFSAAEMAEKAKNGDYEGFKSLTKFQKEGIRRARHEAAGLKLQEHMQTWQSTATLPDENGNPVPLDQITDSDRVIDAFNRESARWLMEKTGGQYDPVLAQEYIRDPERSAMNQFIQQQAAKRNAQIRAEQRLAATELMDAYTSPIINDGLFDVDPYTAGRRFYDNISYVAETLMRDGVSQSDASEFLGQYMQSALRSVNSHDLIDKMLAIAQVHPLLQDPTLKEQIIAAAEYGHRSVEWAKDREEEQKKELAEQQAFDLYEKLRTGTATQADMAAFSQSSPANAAALTQMQKQLQAGFDAAMAMLPEDYDRYRIETLHGEIKYNGFLADLSRLNDAQRDEIGAIIRTNEERSRAIQNHARAQGRYMTKDDVDKLLKTRRGRVQKVMEELLKPTLGINAPLSDGEAANGMRAQSRTEEAILNEWLAWQRKFPAEALDYYADEAALIEIAQKHTALLVNNWKTYMTDPSTLAEPPYRLMVDTAKNYVDSALGLITSREGQQQLLDAINTGDAVQTEKILKRYGKAQNYNAAELIRNHRIVEEDARTMQKKEAKKPNDG